MNIYFTESNTTGFTYDELNTLNAIADVLIDRSTNQEYIKCVCTRVLENSDRYLKF
jgi:hypothetical protein